MMYLFLHWFNVLDIKRKRCEDISIFVYRSSLPMRIMFVSIILNRYLSIHYYFGLHSHFISNSKILYLFTDF